MYHDKLIKNAHCPLIGFHIERKIQSWREESWWRHQSSVVVSLCRVNWPRAAQALTSAGAVAWKIDLPTSIKNDWTQKIKRQTVTVLNSKITRKIKKKFNGTFWSIYIDWEKSQEAITLIIQTSNLYLHLSRHWVISDNRRYCQHKAAWPKVDIQKCHMLVCDCRLLNSFHLFLSVQEVCKLPSELCENSDERTSFFLL